MSAEKVEAIIPADVEVQGQIKSGGDIRVDGKLNGDLVCSGSVVIGESAIINGNLSVNSIVVSGMLTGNISAKERVDLKSTAKLTGDIKSKRLTVEDGVVFVGKSEVNPSGTQARAPEQVGEAAAPSPRVPLDQQELEGAPQSEPDSALDQKKSKASSLFGRK